MPKSPRHLFQVFLAFVSLLLLCECNKPSAQDAAEQTSGILTRMLCKADSLAAIDRDEEALLLYHQIDAFESNIQADDTASAQCLLNAALVESQIYFSKFSDYAQVLSALTRSRRIAERYGLNMSATDFLTGYLMLTIAEQNNSSEYYRKGAEYFNSVLSDTVAQNESLRHDAATNLILFSTEPSVKQISHRLVRKYLDCTEYTAHSDYVFNLLMDSLIRVLDSQRYAEGSRIIEKIKSTPDLPEERILPGVCYLAGKIALSDGQPSKALTYLKEAESIISPDQSLDIKLQLDELLADTYCALGDKARMGEYAMEANRLRKQLTSFSQISSFKRAELQEEIESMQRSLNQERDRNISLRKTLSTVVCVALAAATVIAMLFYFVRQLKAKNKLLYLRYVEHLKLVDKLNHMECDQNADKTAGSLSSELIQTEVTSAAAFVTDPEHVMKIEAALACESELFSADFNLATLSVSTGIKTRQLSSIIANHYHTTFRNLINSRRIQFICRKLELTDELDHLTVDAIAESVGIKSRTTFTSAFKRETDMTPAQYFKLARNNRDVQLCVYPAVDVASD